MFNRNTSPESLGFINALNDNMITARQILRPISDLADQSAATEKKGGTCSIKYSSLSITLSHIDEHLLPAGDMAQKRWRVARCKSGNVTVEEK